MFLTDMVEFNHVISEYFSQFFAGLVQFSLNKVLLMLLKEMVEHSTETRLNSIEL